MGVGKEEGFAYGHSCLVFTMNNSRLKIHGKWKSVECLRRNLEGSAC